MGPARGQALQRCQAARAPAEFLFLTSTACNCSRSNPQLPKPLSALEIKIRDYKRHHDTGTIVDELAKRASPAQNWGLPWERDHPIEERQGTWHPCIPPKSSSHQGRSSWVPPSLWEPQIHQHKQSVDWGGGWEGRLKKSGQCLPL